MSLEAAEPRKPLLPLFALLESPYGMINAVATTLPVYVLHAQGVSLEKAAAMTALCTTPGTFYFLYSPLIDFFVRRRTWYLLTLLCLVALTGATILLPAATHIQALTALLFIAFAVGMLLSAATGGMANTLSADGKKNVGAWLQLGNLGAASLMVALLVYASARCSRPALAIMVMSAMLVPGLAILAVNEPPHREPFTSFGSTMRETGAELRAIFFSWRAVPGLLLLVSPIGNSVIATVMMGLTKMYGATEAQLTFANGWGGGVVTAVGALCALLVPKSWNRMVPYALTGVVYGAVSVAIGALPLTPGMFMAGLLATNFAAGIAFGMYTGVVLQTAGFGGLRHSTRYTILNSVGNLPIVYMLALLGAIAGRKGIHAAGITDGALNLGSAVVFFAWWAWARRWRPEILQVMEVPGEAIPAA